MSTSQDNLDHQPVMKKFLALAFIILNLVNYAFADDISKLRIKIAGVTNNNYFLCLENSRCVSLYAGNAGRAFPLENGSIGDIILANARSKLMYIQSPVNSCNVSVNEGQTLTISGSLSLDANQTAVIHDLQCSVS